MRYLIAGGGTGGHLFPGLAVAEELRLLDADAQLLFLCTTRPFDREQLERAGMPFQSVPAPRLGRDLESLSLLPWRVFKACREAMEAMRRFRPDVVVGLGGYGAFPALFVAHLQGTPIVLLEQNVLPGRVTRHAAPWAEAVLTGWPGSERFLPPHSPGARIEVTGIPLRRSVQVAATGRREAAARFGFDPGRTTLLVLGGSQGAESVNRFVLDALGTSAPRGLQVIHLCGAAHVEATAAAYLDRPCAARVHSFWPDMGAAYAAADVAVSRAGGSSLAELAAAGMPSVLLPYPHAADDHQRYNAEAIEAAGGAFSITPDREPLGRRALAWLLWDPSARAAMGERMRAAGRPDARGVVARRVMEAAGRRSTVVGPRSSVDGLRSSVVGRQSPVADSRSSMGAAIARLGSL